MIEYSIYMMGNPIKPEEPQKAYAKNQVREIWDLNKFCKHIASHNAGYSRGMVKAILSDMCDCIVEQLLNGNKIKLGEFGVFSISINCEGAESLEKFTEENIKSVNIKFNPGVDFENLVDKAEFKLVASRAGQAALLKAEKANETTVDLEAAKKKPPACRMTGFRLRRHQGLQRSHLSHSLTPHLLNSTIRSTTNNHQASYSSSLA